jgi:hypothetical protein
MQPYFFPYLGYLDLVRCTDRWIVFDDVQYIRHGWVNRNRILHPTSGWQFIIAPLSRHPQSARISEVQVVEGNAWKERIIGQLDHYRKRAPHFRTTLGLVRECLDGAERLLSRINIRALARICACLDIPFHYDVFSEMDLGLPSIAHAGEWALRISEKVGATEYVNPPGGAALFDEKAFAASGIKLTIRD